MGLYLGHNKAELIRQLKGLGVVGVSRLKRRQLLAIYIKAVKARYPHLFGRVVRGA